MAAFCTKCGAPSAGDTAFCTKCGAPLSAPTSAAPVGAAPTSAAPVGAAPTPAAYIPPASNAPARPYTPPAAAYTQPTAAYVQPVPVGAAPVKGGSALKIILIIIVVFVGIGILCVAGIMFGLWRVSKVVHVSDNGKGGISVTTPGGTYSAGNTPVSASDLGVDLYPGATQQQGAVRVNTPGGSAVSATYVTSDSMDKVIDFYKGKLGATASVFQSDKSAVLTLTNEDKKDSVMVTISSDTPGQIKIGILHSKQT
jgi:hypothetical protein